MISAGSFLGWLRPWEGHLILLTYWVNRGKSVIDLPMDNFCQGVGGS